MRHILFWTATAAAAALVGGCDSNRAETDANIAANDSDAAVQASTDDAPAVPMIDASGKVIGEVRSGDGPDGARLMIDARGLPPGEHGLHIHDAGLCELPDFKSAGGHWNPTGKKHGSGSADGAHLGDLSNVTVGADGVLRTDVAVAGTYLRTAQPSAQAILGGDGAALVVHAKADDYKTDPSGDSGDRIACAVLGTAEAGSVSSTDASGTAAANTQ
ncbi:superoxide dismutase family protein [Sphingomonas sabuli]|uniref:Superoxide dismutase family protein n=1 Tax=Sphingomonas sabuli TaxID=2764186 RepID=A0A7G9L2G5_9SPHN|nr:superoxide dismutase family protein [Sphingomonas sabuli]QNM82814.1 superoxide dismutase family protein [Sphingomonas sabuli]